MFLRQKSIIKVLTGEDLPVGHATEGCLHPRRLSYVSSLGVSSQMVCDCGCCYNCLASRRNEMVTRMILHDQAKGSPWKHCYFITLTYNSANYSLFNQHPFKNDWYLTYPILTTHNEKGRPAWTPTLLRREHIIKFLKRLRFNMPSHLFSYVYCGEYGETYSRPHFHLILWSDKPVTLLDIRHAWSYKGVRTSDKKVIKNYRGQKDVRFDYLPIGAVKMYDLCDNGSTNRHVKPNETNNSYCSFSYVAKYLNKLDFACGPVLYDRFMRVFTILRDIQREDEIKTYDPDFVPIDLLDSINITVNNIYYEKVNFAEFKKLFSPFVGSSRQYAIGKQYCIENLSRFEAQNYALPDWRGKTLVFPRYFNFLLAKKKYPIRLQKRTFNGISLSKDNLNLLRTLFMELREDSNVYLALSHSPLYVGVSSLFGTASAGTVESVRRKLADLNVKDTINSKDLSFNHILDSLVFTSERNTLHYSYSPLYDTFFGYVYNRNTNTYDYFDAQSREDFCDYVISFIDSEIPRIRKSTALALSASDCLSIFESPDYVKQVASARENYIARRDYNSYVYHKNKSKIF